MRMAGRFARREHGWAASAGVPVINYGRGEHKHQIASESLAEHTVLRPGVFLAEPPNRRCVARGESRTESSQRNTSDIVTRRHPHDERS
jgi:hypothetical protein